MSSGTSHPWRSCRTGTGSTRSFPSGRPPTHVDGCADGPGTSLGGPGLSTWSGLQKFRALKVYPEAYVHPCVCVCVLTAVGWRCPLGNSFIPQSPPLLPAKRTDSFHLLFTADSNMGRDVGVSEKAQGYVAVSAGVAGFWAFFPFAIIQLVPCTHSWLRTHSIADMCRRFPGRLWWRPTWAVRPCTSSCGSDPTS